MDTEYIESVWWSLKRLHGSGLLFEADQGHDVLPPVWDDAVRRRDGDGLRGGGGPERLRPVPPRRGARCRSLVGAAPARLDDHALDADLEHGVAVAQQATYVQVEQDGERYVLAKDRLARASSRMHVPLVGSSIGTTLVGARYEPLYPNVEGAHRVVAADFVSLEDGTGVVHMAPAFGPEDLEVGRREGWRTFKPIDGEGRFTDEAPRFVRGLFFKDADEPIAADLRSRGLLLRAETIVHTYPLCWRCSTPLLYIARTSWYVGPRRSAIGCSR